MVGPSEMSCYFVNRTHVRVDLLTWFARDLTSRTNAGRDPTLIQPQRQASRSRSSQGLLPGVPYWAWIPTRHTAVPKRCSRKNSSRTRPSKQWPSTRPNCRRCAKRPRACGRFGGLETPSIRKCGPRQLEGRAGVTVVASWTKQRAGYKGLSLIIFAAAEAANQVSYAKRNHGSRVDTAAAAAELRQKTRRAVCGEPVSLKKPERYSATASRNQSIFCGVAALRCRLRWRHRGWRFADPCLCYHLCSGRTSDLYLRAHRLTVWSARENEPRFLLSNSELRRTTNMNAQRRSVRPRQTTNGDGFRYRGKKRSLYRGILDYPSHMSSIAIGGYRSLGRQRTAASWIIPRTCHRSRSVVIGPSVGSAEARTRERYHRSRAAEQRDEL